MFPSHLKKVSGETLETDDLVGLHTNPHDERFLNVGRVIIISLGQERPLFGSLGFAQTQREIEVEVYYRIRNNIGDRLDRDRNAGPDSLRERYLQLGGNFRHLQKRYEEIFGEGFDFF